MVDTKTEGTKTLKQEDLKILNWAVLINRG